EVLGPHEDQRLRERRKIEQQERRFAAERQRERERQLRQTNTTREAAVLTERIAVIEQLLYDATAAVGRLSQKVVDELGQLEREATELKVKLGEQQVEVCELRVELWKAVIDDRKGIVDLSQLPLRGAVKADSAGGQRSAKSGVMHRSKT